MDIIYNLWDFFQKQILGMKWLNNFIGSILQMLGLEKDTTQYNVVNFFIYDSIKIFVLLSVLVFIISLIQSYFPPQRTRKILGKTSGIFGRCLGALLGILTPFCSCSSIPIFIGFSSAGLPIGVTLSFLIMSPMADLGSLTLIITEFGYKIALIYIITGFIISIVGGTIIEKMGFEKYISDFIKNARFVEVEEKKISKKERLKIAFVGVRDIIKKVWLYILIGVAIGSFIHNIIPQEIVQNLLGGEHWYSVILAVVVGVPMYADIFGAIPIAQALLLKGAGLGTVLSFMMSITALSLPSIIMLKKAMKPKLLLAFVLIVSLGIILTGYLFNNISFIL